MTKIRHKIWVCTRKTGISVFTGKMLPLYKNSNKNFLIYCYLADDIKVLGMQSIFVNILKPQSPLKNFKFFFPKHYSSSNMLSRNWFKLHLIISKKDMVRSHTKILQIFANVSIFSNRRIVTNEIKRIKFYFPWNHQKA